MTILTPEQALALAQIEEIESLRALAAALDRAETAAARVAFWERLVEAEEQPAEVTP